MSQTATRMRRSLPGDGAAATSADVFLGRTSKPIRPSRETPTWSGGAGHRSRLASHCRFGSGSLALAELVAPAVRLARDGVAIRDDLFDSSARTATSGTVADRGTGFF